VNLRRYGSGLDLEPGRCTFKEAKSARDMIQTKKPKIAIFVSFSGQGGVERMMVNLCEGLMGLGCQVELILVKSRGPYQDVLPPGLNVIRLGASHTMSSLPFLISYLRRARPQALLSAKDRANQVAIVARHLAGVPTRIAVRMGTTLSAALAEKSFLKEKWWYLRMRMLYPLADAVIAVSRGVADDLRRNAALPEGLLHVVANPVLTPRLSLLAGEVITHPWFAKGGAPVIIGVGRLTRQKDFPTLIRAFAKVRSQRECKLVILGEGRNRPALEQLAKERGVRDDVDLPGFAGNPYAYMSRSSLFVLSSVWEGSPNVLTEALALGVPSVATDCPSGPREILQDGRFGRLVTVGDSDALAYAMLETLAHPPDPMDLKKAVSAYSVEASSRRYLEVLLGRRVE
jgi:glycosyltransferase involved in cell wall biosynthesis